MSSNWGPDQDRALANGMAALILEHRTELYALPALAKWRGNGGSTINSKVKQLLTKTLVSMYGATLEIKSGAPRRGRITAGGPGKKGEKKLPFKSEKVKSASASTSSKKRPASPSDDDSDDDMDEKPVKKEAKVKRESKNGDHGSDDEGSAKSSDGDDEGDDDGGKTHDIVVPPRAPRPARAASSNIKFYNVDEEESEESEDEEEEEEDGEEEGAKEGEKEADGEGEQEEQGGDTAAEGEGQGQQKEQDGQATADEAKEA